MGVIWFDSLAFMSVTYSNCTLYPLRNGDFYSTYISYIIAVYIDSYVTMSSDLYGTCRHCFYGTRFGYCSKGTKSSSDNIVPIFIHPII